MINTSPTGMMAAAARAYMQPKSQNQGMSGEGSPESESSQAKIPDPEELKTEWNKFVDWMHTTATVKTKDPKTGKIVEEKAWKNPKLDKGDLGNKLFQQYIKETGSKLSAEDVPVIRQMYGQYLDQYGRDILAGKKSIVDRSDPEGKFIMFDPSNPTSPTSQKAAAMYRDLRAWYDENEKSPNPNYVGVNMSSLIYPVFGGTYKGAPAKSMKDLQSREMIPSEREGRVL